MTKIKSKLYFFFFILMFLVISCRKPTLTNWDTDIVLPLVSGNLKIDDFLGDTLFTSDSSNQLYIKYEKKVLDIKPDSILKIRDTFVVNSFTNFFPFNINPGQNINFLPPSETTFDIPNGTKIKTAYLKRGKLKLYFSNFVNQPIDLIYKIPSVNLYGIPFEIMVTVPSGLNSVIKEIDLSNYQLNLTGISGYNFNTLYQTYTVGLNPNAYSTVVPSGTFAQIKAEYQNIVPFYIEGYFGNHSIKFGTDTIKLDIFKNLGIQNFSLSAAQVNFKIFNFIGADFKGEIHQFKAIKDQQSVNLNHAGLFNINVNRATKSNNLPIKSIKILSIHQQNSNITSFLSILPSKIAYQGTIICNPLGNTSGFQDFSYHNYGIELYTDILIPLKFNADYFFLSSDIDLDLTSFKQLKNIKEGGLKFYIENGYPFALQLQAYLLNENLQIIDSLLPMNNNIAQSGALNNQNMVISSTKTILFMPLNIDIIKKMLQTKKIRLKAKLIMPPQPPEIIIKADYGIKVNIIADVTYNVKRN